MKELVNELLESSTCCKEAKEKAQEYLDNLGSENENVKLSELIAELKEDISSIDDVISFASSDFGKQLLGNEKAQGLLEHVKHIKLEGAEYCDCPACSVAAKIIALSK